MISCALIMGECVMSFEKECLITFSVVCCVALFCCGLLLVKVNKAADDLRFLEERVSALEDCVMRMGATLDEA